MVIKELLEKTPFMHFLDGHKLFKGDPFKGDLKKEARCQRRVVRLLNKDARALGKKQDFVEFILRRRQVPLDRIKKMMNLIIAQRAYIQRYLALEKVEMRVDDNLQHALTIAYTNDQEREEMIRVMSERGDPIERMAVSEFFGEIKERIGQEGGLVQHETEAAHEFAEDATKGIRVLQKWEEILNEQARLLSEMEKEETSRKAGKARRAQVKQMKRFLDEEGELVSASVDAFAKLVHQEVMLLHLLLRDERTKSHVVSEMKRFCNNFEGLEDATRTVKIGKKGSRAWWTAKRALEAAAALAVIWALQGPAKKVGSGIDGLLNFSDGLLDKAKLGTEAVEVINTGLKEATNKAKQVEKKIEEAEQAFDEITDSLRPVGEFLGVPMPQKGRSYDDPEIISEELGRLQGIAEQMQVESTEDIEKAQGVVGTLQEIPEEYSLGNASTWKEYTPGTVMPALVFALLARYWAKKGWRYYYGIEAKYRKQEEILKEQAADNARAMYGKVQLALVNLVDEMNLVSTKLENKNIRREEMEKEQGDAELGELTKTIRAVLERPDVRRGDVPPAVYALLIKLVEKQQIMVKQGLDDVEEDLEELRDDLKRIERQMKGANKELANIIAKGIEVEFASIEKKIAARRRAIEMQKKQAKETKAGFGRKVAEAIAPGPLKPFIRKR